MISVYPQCTHSAGVGTLITIDCVLEQLQEEKVVDIAGVIIHLRTQRMKLVESLVCRVISFITQLATWIDCTHIRSSISLSTMQS